MNYFFVPLFLPAPFVRATAAPDSTLARRDSLRKIQLNEIVITASRMPESILNSPVSMELLDARQIRMSIGAALQGQSWAVSCGRTGQVEPTEVL